MVVWALTTGQLATTLGIAAAFLTALVSAVGLLINRQAEIRAKRQQEDELERLRLEAAMRAGLLLNGDDKQPASPGAVASGLLALTELDRPDLAVVLLVDLWDSKEDRRISTETAILVLNAALASQRRGAQLIAAELLCRNAASLDPCQSLHWPTAIDGRWNPEFGPRTKLLLVDAVVRMTYSAQPSENALRSIAVRLFAIWRDDPSARVKGCIGMLINAILPALEALGYEDFMGGPLEVSLNDLKAAARTKTHHPDGLLERTSADRSAHLKRWSEGCRQALLSPGSLATTYAQGVA